MSGSASIPRSSSSSGGNSNSNSVLDIVKEHARVPLNEDISLVLTLLEGWHRYTYCTSLEEKESFPSELWVKCYPAAGEGERPAGAAPPLHPLRQPSGAGAEDTGDSRAFIKRFPMQLWSAVLPWEVQKGLSLSPLRAPSGCGIGDGAVEREKKQKEEEEVKVAGSSAGEDRGVGAEDPFGVVTPTTDAPSGGGAAGEQGRCAQAPDRTPGMLFLMDNASDTAAAAADDDGDNGSVLRFWSGAILEPIDVLFCAYRFPSIITHNHSFAKLLQRTAAEKSEQDKEISSKVIRRYFPYKEYENSLYNNLEGNNNYRVNGSAASARLVVTSHGHLDPFPFVVQRYTGRSAAPARGGKWKFTISSSEGGGGGEAPRMVLETTFAFLQTCVQQAVAEAEAGGRRVAEIEVELKLSSQLTHDLLQKSHINCEYVGDVERYVRRYLKLLNTPFYYGGRGGGGGDGDGPTPAESSADGDDGQRVKVWVSEEECVYMTMSEIRQLQRENIRKAAQTPQDAASEGSGDDDSDYLARRDEEEEDGGGAGGDAAAPCQTAVVKSAFESSKYPLTSAQIPLLPPIHYRLFYYCLLLGVCREEAFYHYYGRIMREFQSEYKRLKAARKAATSDNTQRRRIDSEDLGTMVDLVRDATMQLPGDLIGIVEAVAALAAEVEVKGGK